MVINNSNRRTELYLSLFPSIRNMYMNGLMLIHIEEKTYSKNYISNVGICFSAKIGIIFYTCK